MSRFQRRITLSLMLLCGLVITFVIVINSDGWTFVLGLLGIMIWTSPFLLKWILNGRKKDKELAANKD